MAAKFRFEPCPSCCEPPCTTCQEGTAPASLQIVIAGITNTFCFACGNLNGTFVLTQRTTGICLWSYTLSPSVCSGLQFLGAEIYQSSGHYWLEVSWGGGSPISLGDAWWLLDLGTSVPDCGFNDVAVPHVGHILIGCSDASATCHVTAL